METLIRNKPDVYVMTGTARVRAGAHVIPFGYGATQQRARQAMALLMNRPGFEYLARALYPQTLGQLDPDATYRRILATYTDIPDAPFLFETRRAFDGQGACPP